MVKAPEAWAKGYTGGGVTIAVVDTGVNYRHEGLRDNIWSNVDEVPSNNIDDDNNDPMDVTMANYNRGHGTHVAGIIAAKNGYPVTGVAYDAKIMPIRVMDERNEGTNANIAKGVLYAVENKANIVNLSLEAPITADLEEAIRYAESQGVVVVMGAGNDGAPQPSFPASLATDVGSAAGAVDKYKQVWPSSNRAGAVPLNYVVAPGVDVTSTIPNIPFYGTDSGTSFAAPHVSGIVALLQNAVSKYSPDGLAPQEVKDLLALTADPDELFA